jgi:hypothetical protein
VRRIACLVAVALVSCTGADAGTGASPPATGAERDVFVRTCDSRVSGALGAGWRTGQVKRGPVVFVGARGYADDRPTLFAAPGDRATVHKVLLVVTGARAVEVAVRHPDAALFYDERRWRERNVAPFRLGDTRTRFEPCGGGHGTQFNGGFLLRGPACVPVEVRVEGEAPRFATLSFGAGDCD